VRRLLAVGGRRFSLAHYLRVLWLRDMAHMFRTKGQRKFIEAFCNLAEEAMHYGDPGEHIIDMDKVADEVAESAEQAKFYYVEVI
jgi:hypothetical protein